MAIADINEYIESLVSSPGLGPQVAGRLELPAREPEYSEPEKPWPEEITGILRIMGISDLYRHQNLAMELVRAGRHVVSERFT